jgi:hypothetical protein
VERAADFPVPDELPLLLVSSASVSIWLAVPESWCKRVV